MGLWGSIVGGVVGFVTGGPLGGVMGAALGHAAAEGAAPGAAGQGAEEAAGAAAALGSRETLFAISVVVLSAKLAKCDGPVARAEIDAFKAQFRVPPESLAEVGRLFDRARDEAGGPESFARRLGAAFADNRPLLEDVLGALFAIARADGPANVTEIAYLRAVQRGLGLDAAAWDRARGGVRGNAGAGAGPGAGAGVRPEPGAPDPYAALGLTAAASDAQVRGAWRALVRENHPDGLAARGVPATAVARATARVAEINAAWDRIKRQRGL